jgi:serine phosphatase RsbU (regulator of sigma subunit)/CheY-like chemotaxis protein
MSQSSKFKKTNPTIVLVDDEDFVLTSIKSLLELETSYRILTFESPREALGAIKRNPVDVIVTDFFMPELNGIQFLMAVKEIYPDLPAVLLTGYADKENAINGINKVGLFQYIEKPWDNDQLIMVIKNAIETTNLRRQLRDKISELDNTIRQKEDLFEHNSLIKQELDLARKLQMQLLPSDLPEIEGINIVTHFQPMIEIGGDYYDIIRLVDDSWSVLVADATGHGIRAALGTALLKFAFNSFSGKDVSPQEILSGMNSILCTGLPEDMYIAAIVANINPKERTVSLANAGLTYPLWIHTDKDDYELVSSQGMLLGLMDDSLFKPGEEKSIILSDKESIIFYTDGLSETQSTDKKLFEDDAMWQELARLCGKRCCDVVSGLIQSARKFCCGKHDDDITVFGVEFCKKG